MKPTVLKNLLATLIFAVICLSLRLVSGAELLESMPIIVAIAYMALVFVIVMRKAKTDDGKRGIVLGSRYKKTVFVFVAIGVISGVVGASFGRLYSTILFVPAFIICAWIVYDEVKKHNGKDN